MKRIPLLLALLPLVAACEPQESQSLPFDAGLDPVTRTLPASGGVISTPAGAAVTFPAGAVGDGQSVSLEATHAASDFAASGTAVSEHSFSLEPAGLRLAAPATAEIRFAPGDAASAWLASLVIHTPGGVTEHGDTRVDVSTGIASAPVSVLGAMAVVVPASDAVFPIAPVGAPPAASEPSSRAVQRIGEADSLSVHCGGPGSRCAGLSAGASENLRARVTRAALVYPRLDGALRYVDGEVVGRVRVVAAFRAEIASGRVADNLLIDEEFAFRVRVAPPGSLPGFSGARAVADADAEAVSLYLPEDGAPPSATVRHRLEIPVAGGGTETATVAITFPFQIHR